MSKKPCKQHVLDKHRILDDKVFECENCGRTLLEIIEELKANPPDSSR